MPQRKKVKPQMHYKTERSEVNEGAYTPVSLSVVLRLYVYLVRTPSLRTRHLCQTKYGKAVS